MRGVRGACPEAAAAISFRHAGRIPNENRRPAEGRGWRCLGGRPPAHRDGRATARQPSPRSSRCPSFSYVRGGSRLDNGADREYSRQPRPEDLAKICGALNQRGVHATSLSYFLNDPQLRSVIEYPLPITELKNEDKSLGTHAIDIPIAQNESLPLPFKYIGSCANQNRGS